MNRRLTLIRRARLAIDQALIRIGFGGDQIAKTALVYARRWLEKAKKYVMEGWDDLARIAMTNATTHLATALTQMED